MPRILIADDSADVRRSLRALIECRGDWEVCGEAVDGAEAVIRAKELHPDLIVLDFSMPVMDGIHAAREIGKIAPDVPILLYTAHLSIWLIAEAQKAGIEGAVSKIQTRALVEAIGALLRSESYFDVTELN
ncbi:MAG: response regulator [Candidatus Acidiferrales bacterium]